MTGNGRQGKGKGREGRGEGERKEGGKVRYTSPPTNPGCTTEQHRCKMVTMTSVTSMD
jgi:hypothetical protein